MVILLITVFQKFIHAAHFHFVIVNICSRSKFDFLDFDNFLFFTGFGFAFLLLVFIFTKIHDFAHGWVGIGRNFHQIQTDLICKFLAACGGNHPYVFTFGPNEPYFRAVYAIIYARSGFARWWRVVRSASYGFIPYVVNGS
jgi:cell division protein FtsW (lipid II flippase)